MNKSSIRVFCGLLAFHLSCPVVGCSDGTAQDDGVFDYSADIAATVDEQKIIVDQLKEELEDAEVKGVGGIPYLGTKKMRQRAAKKDPERRKEIEVLRARLSAAQKNLKSLQQKDKEEKH